MKQKTSKNTDFKQATVDTRKPIGQQTGLNAYQDVDPVVPMVSMAQWQELVMAPQWASATNIELHAMCNLGSYRAYALKCEVFDLSPFNSRNANNSDHFLEVSVSL